MDAVYLLVNEAGLEADLRATVALASDVDVIAIRELPGVRGGTTRQQNLQ